jgi:hypothetical protein
MVLLFLAVIAYGLSKIGWMPKANWLEIGFALAAGAAVVALVFP